MNAIMPYLQPSPLTVGQNGGSLPFREMTLTVDCRPRFGSDIGPWALYGMIAGGMGGLLMGSIRERNLREVLSKKRRRQREASKKRRQQQQRKQKEQTKGRLVGDPAKSQSAPGARRKGDFPIPYMWSRGAVGAVLGAVVFGLGRGLYRLVGGFDPMTEQQCRDDALQRLKANPSSMWAILGLLGGGTIYLAQYGGEPLRKGDGEFDHFALYSLFGGLGSYFLSRWFV